MPTTAEVDSDGIEGRPTASAATKSNVPIASLTSVRGLAASWIVLYHFQGDLYRLFPRSISLKPFLFQGQLAVACFFILSGFVLSYNYADRLQVFGWPAYRKFVSLRLARVYPVHLFTLLVVLAMVLVSHSSGIAVDREGYSARDFVLNLLLMQTWVPHFRLNWNYPAWSISSEWFAYLWFPFVCKAASRSVSRRTFLILGALSFCVMQVHGIFARSLPFAEMLGVVGTFLTGCAIYFILQSEGTLLRIWRRAPDLTLVLALVAPFLLQGIYLLLVMLSLFTVLIYSLALLQADCSRFWTSASIIFLGEISYSLYMTHTLVQKVLNEVAPSSAAASGSLLVRAGVLCLYVLLISAVAIVTYYAIERPARLWMRRISSRRNLALVLT